MVMVTDPKKAGQLHQELIDMPEFRLRKQLDSIKIPIYIFDKNYAELKALLEFFINDPKSFPLTFQRNRDKLEELQLDILRRLHNFVASALTLIDHTRIYYRELYGDTDKFPDYLPRLSNEFEKDPLSQFVKCLRIYCQHYAPPNIIVEESLIENPDGTPKIEKKVLLRTEDLISFDRWNSTAREYLNKPDKQIDLLEIIDLYRTKVINFYLWVISRQNEIHKNEIFLVDQKRVEFIQTHLLSIIDSRLRDESRKATIEEDIFSGIISSYEIVNLETLDAPPNIKADYAILLLSNHIPVPEILCEKIRKLYRENNKKK
jgi:hypothetical protein